MNAIGEDVRVSGGGGNKNKNNVGGGGGEGNDLVVPPFPSSSSGKKRAKQLIQCANCGCFLLAKDFESHSQQIGGDASKELNRELSSSQAAAATAAQHLMTTTPKLQSQKRGVGRPKKTAAAVKKTVSSSSPSATTTTTFSCGQPGFLLSQLPLIEQGVGLAIEQQQQLLVENGDEMLEWWERHSAMTEKMYGWQKRHSAFVHPLMLATVGAPPRGAFIIIGQALEHCLQTAAADLVITLLPCEEVPLMRIALPPELLVLPTFKRSATTFEQQFPLLRLRLVRFFGRPLSNILLKPNRGEGSNISLGEWKKLAALSHFPYFLRCYFGNAILCFSSSSNSSSAPFSSQQPQQLEMFYYGRKLSFQLVAYGEEEEEGKEVGRRCGEEEGKGGGGEGGGEEGGEGELEEQKSEEVEGVPRGGELEEEEQQQKQQQQSASVHRVSPNCKFKVDWNEILLLENKDDYFDDVSDLEGLL